MIQLESQRSARIGAPVDAVFGLIADFGSIARWWPVGLLRDVEIEGAGIGMVRTLHISVGIVLRERLDALDAEEHAIEYSTSGDLPVGICAFSTLGRVVANGTDHCTMEWTGRYQIPQRSAEIAAREFVEGSYSTLFRAVRDALARRPKS